MGDRESLIRGYLLHLGYNMWLDREAPELGEGHPYLTAQPHLRVDEGLWDEIVEALAAAGMNMVVVDLGEGVRYESHPEIGVEGSWTVEKLRGKLDRMRELGLEPIPKMNFSTTHDAWLGEYSRCVSSSVYYGVCRDLIAEACSIFDSPRLFHLGMDEEDLPNQKHQQYVMIRQYDLWWHDLEFLVGEVEKAGARAWVWSDFCWAHPEEYYRRMPRSVLQSNWWYHEVLDPEDRAVQAYVELEREGYDQVPTGSNWTSPRNFGRTVEFAAQNIAPERLKGFLQTVWRPTLQACRETHLAAIRQAGEGLAEV